MPARTAAVLVAAVLLALAYLGFGGGPGGGRYLPAGAVRRDPMASFVARALDRTLEQGMAEPPAR